MKFQYCLSCGAPLRQENLTKYVCQNNHQSWNNPRAAAGVVLLNKESRALFAKRAREPKKELYQFPGGFLNFGEQAEDGARREAKEETGLDVSKLSLIASYTHDYEENVSTCVTVFVSNSWAGQIMPADDVCALEWKPIGFIDSAEFARPFTGLTVKLKDYYGR